MVEKVIASMSGGDGFADVAALGSAFCCGDFISVGDDLPDAVPRGIEGDVFATAERAFAPVSHATVTAGEEPADLQPAACALLGPRWEGDKDTATFRAVLDHNLTVALARAGCVGGEQLRRDAVCGRDGFLDEPVNGLDPRRAFVGFAVFSRRMPVRPRARSS